MTNTDSEEQPLLGGFAQSNRTVRSSLKRFLESKTGHYAVLILVSLDVSSIFVGFILQLLVCDGNLSPKDGSQGSEVLSVISLVFSSLFMLELVVSIYAFGRVYVTRPLPLILTARLTITHKAISNPGSTASMPRSFSLVSSSTLHCEA